MNILFVSAVLPYPLYSGGQVRVYNLLKKLSSKHAITLASFIRDDDERQLAKHLSFCKKVIPVYRGRAWRPAYIARALIGTYPWLLATYDNEEMRAVLARELATGAYDVVHIEPGYVWPSIPETTVPIVVGEHNIEHHIYEGYAKQSQLMFARPFFRHDVAKLIAWEKKIWQAAAAVVTVSPDDKKEVEQITGQNTADVAPNGVDVDEFVFQKQKNMSAAAPVFLFVGNFLWMQNRDALHVVLDDMWERVRLEYPQATFRVVGKHLRGELRRKVARAEGVTLFEDVSEIHDEFIKSDMLLAPIRIGGGTKFKILEAMAAGTPVITTSVGAKGLDVTHGVELMIADDSQGAMRAIRTLISDPKETANLRLRARKKIEQDYSWTNIAILLSAVWQRVYEKFR